MLYEAFIYNALHNAVLNVLNAVTNYCIIMHYNGIYSAL